MRQGNLQSSRAKVRTLAWIDEQFHSNASITEADIANTLEAFYQEEEGFQGLSFNTIAGAGPASSIVHYGTPDADRIIQPGDWILLDSGAHYWGSTTDDTRAVVFANQVTEKQKTAYTAVLKAYIAASSAIFPQGTNGIALDALCRAPLWASGLDFGHGTGHGVGAFLNVHEGPNGIHRRAKTPFEVGQINSIEPGYYEPGWGGIRLENLVEVIDAEVSSWKGNEPSSLADISASDLYSLFEVVDSYRSTDTARVSMASSLSGTK